MEDGRQFCEKNPKRACPQCPFSKQCEPGALGGSPPEVYVGQAFGPFWLPCHLHSDFDDPAWKSDTEKPQCAGAAIFRANLGIDSRLPPQLHRLPPGSDPDVFATFTEFLMHHAGLSREEALTWQFTHPPDACLRAELLRAAQAQLTEGRKTLYEITNRKA